MNSAHSLTTLFLLLVMTTSPAEAKTFDVETYVALNDVSETSTSPDRRFVAYTVTANDIEKDEQVSRVWMLATDSGASIPMTSPESSASSPKWSPDNRYLAVLSDRKDEKNQVWLLNRDGGDAVQLTDVKQGVSAFEWSPDGKRMLLLITDARPADLDEKKRPNPRPWVIDRLQFKQDYVGYLDRHRTHIYVLDVASRQMRQVTLGDYDDSAPAWSPDGTKIVFVSNRTDEPDRNYNSDLWIVDVTADNPEPLQLTTSPAEDDSPAWSPDGRSVVYRTKDEDIFQIYALPQLAVVDVATRETRTFDSLAEIQVFQPRFSRDGSSILAIAETRGEMNLVRISVRSGKVSKLVSGKNTVARFD
ncbi:MAG: PD40 domain-containing protein, partial [Gammaproteobacteria bacterium]|nr:PD40 domain-containing protein [Gammaproteobacteria bacterium]